MLEMMMNLKKKVEPKTFSTLRLTFKTPSVVGLPTPGASNPGVNYGPHVHVVQLAIYGADDTVYRPVDLTARASGSFNANVPANGIDGLNTTHWVSNRIDNVNSFPNGEVWFEINAPLIVAGRLRLYQTSYVSRNIDLHVDGAFYKAIGPIVIPIPAEQNDPVFKDLGYTDIYL